MTYEEKDQLKILLVELFEVPTDERSDEIIEEVNKVILDPDWMDYIFESDDYVNLEDETLKVDELIEKLESYKPINL